MSERKVLNKYYPPDFDPSKIPRSKGGRNKTFTIRLMAPCNMRCTICGEYIYKGRKFNARKEDVDDMNHLGLRIYRFYIKCTACLSEISFRTDPANTDYVLEAGATRNFEALAKAEKQAEMEEKLYQEELKTNPMKLLEERTEQSKNEMERMEALEELQELNKREARPNYGNMLSKYDDLRHQEKRIFEQGEEETVKSIMEENRVKRIHDDEEASGSGQKDKIPMVKSGMFKKSSSSPVGVSAKKPPSWSKSIGGLGTKSSLKASLGGVIVKKKT